MGWFIFFGLMVTLWSQWRQSKAAEKRLDKIIDGGGGISDDRLDGLAPVLVEAAREAYSARMFSGFAVTLSIYALVTLAWLSYR